MSYKTDYVEVAERLQTFYERFPEGSLQGSWEWHCDGKLIVYTAQAYRTPDDPRPGVGTAQEPFPGTTNFTRGSEIQNAETSAWGRAMAALGISTKNGIASAHEVRLAKSRQVTPEQINNAQTLDELRNLWKQTTDEKLHELINKKKEQLS